MIKYQLFHVYFIISVNFVGAYIDPRFMSNETNAQMQNRSRQLYTYRTKLWLTNNYCVFLWKLLNTFIKQQKKRNIVSKGLLVFIN